MIINVCISTDDNFARHCGVTIASILASSGDSDQLNFFILSSSLNLENRRKIMNLQKIKACNIEIIPIDKEVYSDCPLTKRSPYTIGTFFRFSIASLLPQLDKMLYLDSDLVVTASLSPLFSHDITDFYGAMVVDTPSQYMAKKLGMNHTYYNAGVMLINGCRWREDNLESKMLKWAAENSEIMQYPDQDAINVITDGKITALDPRFNVLGHIYNQGGFKQEPVIAHLVGRYKPWNPFTRKPTGILYFKYLKYTDWNRHKYAYFINLIPKMTMVYLTEKMKFILRRISPKYFGKIKALYLKYDK